VEEDTETLVITKLLHFGDFAFIRSILSANHLDPRGVRVRRELDVEVV
jgi:hypothetical protein